MEKVKNILSIIFAMLFCFIIVSCDSDPTDPVTPDPSEETDNETGDEADNETEDINLAEFIVFDDTIVAGTGYADENDKDMWRIYLHMEQFIKDEIDNNIYVVMESYEGINQDEYEIQQDESGYFFEFYGPDTEDAARFNLINDERKIDTSASRFFFDDEDRLEVNVWKNVFAETGHGLGPGRGFPDLWMCHYIYQGGLMKYFFSKEIAMAIAVDSGFINNKMVKVTFFLEFIDGCDGKNMERLYPKEGPIPTNIDKDGEGDYFEMISYAYSFYFRHGIRNEKTGEEYLLYADGYFFGVSSHMDGYQERFRYCNGIHHGEYMEPYQH